MAFPHPTDPLLWLEDGAAAYAPSVAIVAGIFGPKSASITLSGGDKTATQAAGGAFHMARGPVAITGEAYLEFTINALPTPTDSTTGVGLVNAAVNLDTYLTDVNSCGFFSPDNRVGHAPQHQTGFGINAGGYTHFLDGVEWVAGTVIGMAVSLSAKTVKITLDGSTWSPVFDISALGTVLYPAVGFYNVGDSITINGGATPFAYAPPAGFAGPDVAGGLMVAYGHVGGALRSYDFGATQWRGFVAFEPSALDLSSGNETYHLVLEANTAADFTGDSQDLASWNLTALNPQDKAIVNTVYNGVHYRYGRLRIDLGGTSPSIQLKAFLRSLLSISPVSQADQITANFYLLDNLTNANKALRDWSGGSAFGGVYGDGRYPVTDGSGNALYLKSPARILADAAQRSPFEFGAIGDGASHPASGIFATLADCQAVYPFATSLQQEMDFLAMQAWLYAGGGTCQTSQFMMCNANVESQTPLIAISGTFDATGHGSKLLYPSMIEQTDDTEYLLNADFADSSAWSNATIFDPSDILMATFGGGAATMTDTGDYVTQATYYNWGQQITLAPGRYTMTGVFAATLGASYGVNPNPGFINIEFSATSPGEGGNPIGRSAGGRFNLTPDHTSDAKTLSTDFQVTEEITVWACVSGGGFANITCSSFSIKKWLPNCAILATRDGSPDHFPLPRGFHGWELIGPTPYAHSGVTAIRYKSFSNTDGNIVRFTECMVHNFGIGMSFGDGAYLPDFDNVNIYGCGTGVFTQIGAVNAGENLRFNGGGIANNLVGIDNPAAFEITLDKTALDYNYQSIINNNGRIELLSVHEETNVPVEADKPIIHLITGQVTRIGGEFLLKGDVHSSPCAPIHSEFSSAVYEPYAMEPYNISSDPNGAGKGAMMSGPGRFISHGWRNSGNPNIGPLVVSYAPIMDALGGAGKFPAPNIYSADKSGIAFEGGNFPDPVPQKPITASIAGSKLTITGTPTYPVVEGEQVRAPGIKGVPLLSFMVGGGTGGAGDYLVSIPQTVSERAMTAGTDGVIDKWNSIYGTFEWTDFITINGSNCAKFTKGTGATGINSALRLLIPVSAAAVSLGFFRILAPVNYSPVDPAETVPLYYQLHWVRTSGQDEYGRAKIVNNLFDGYKTLDLPRAGSDEWQLCSLLTTYSAINADASAQAHTHSPEWATHLAIYLDTQGLPDGQVFYLADMICNFLR